MVTLPVVVTPPTIWEKAEHLEQAIEQTAKTILSQVKPATLLALEADVEAGLAKVFPGMQSILADIGPALGELSVLRQLVVQIMALKAVPIAAEKTLAAALAEQAVATE